MTKFLPFHTPFETKFLPCHTPFETKFLPFHTPFYTKFFSFHTPKTVHGRLKNGSPPQQQEKEQHFPLPDPSATPQIKRRASLATRERRLSPPLYVAGVCGFRCCCIGRNTKKGYDMEKGEGRMNYLLGYRTYAAAGGKANLCPEHNDSFPPSSQHRSFPSLNSKMHRVARERDRNEGKRYCNKPRGAGLAFVAKALRARCIPSN